MKLFQLLLDALKITGEENDKIFKEQEKMLRLFLASQKEIRIFFGYSQNFGHIATAVNMLYRLISYIETTQVITFRLIYDIDPGEEEPPPDPERLFAQRLVTLIPSLTIDDVIRTFEFRMTDTITLRFNSYNMGKHELKPPLTYEALFCVAGGFDDSENITADLQVKCLLALQPYQFTKYDSKNIIYLAGREDGILLGPLYDRDGVEVTDPDCVFGLTYTDRAYYVQDPKITPSLWKYFERLDKYKYDVVFLLYDLLQNDAIDFFPIYFSEGRILGSSDMFLFNLITGVLKAKQKNPSRNKPCVALMLAELNNSVYTSFNRLINEEIEDQPLLTRYIAQQVRPKTDRFRVLAANATTNDIEDAIARVGKDGIVVVRLGRVQQFVFQYLFSVSTYPCVFEGEGSASLILNIGRPFFHLVSSDLSGMEEAIQKNQLYPTLPFGSGSGPIAQLAHKDSLALVQTEEQWELLLRDFNMTPDSVIGEFIYYSYLTGAGLQRYFGSFRPFYHNPQEDKFLVALLFTVLKIFKQDLVQEEELVGASA
jgi:hypothetical protein